MAHGTRYAWGQVYRDGSLICDRARVTLPCDDQPGAAPRRRRTVIARFDGRLHPALRAELTELTQARGTAARRLAERIEPIVLLLGDPHHERQRIVGQILPPQVHGNDLREIEFRVRELRS
ncbi:MAG: hypothetical protein ACRDLN_13000 [Solirubrobacteraceae bacterium]